MHLRRHCLRLAAEMGAKAAGTAISRSRAANFALACGARPPRGRRVEPPVPTSAPATLADLAARLSRPAPPDAAARQAARRREAGLTKPAGALGRLEELSVWLAGWQGRPRAERVRIVVFAGNHGLAAAGVSAYPASVTAQMVANFRAGGAAINALARLLDAELVVVPLALDRPTEDIRFAAAMDPADFLAAVAAGTAVLDGPKPDLLCVGEMGIGNTSIAAALAAGLFGGSGADWAGPGTGVAGAALAAKIAAIDAALACHRSHLGDPLEVARRLGGRELAAILGAVHAARGARVPVVLDGYVATAAAAPLALLAAGGLDHCVAGHCSAEPAHRRLLDRLGLAPVLDLGMRLGEGSGAALAAQVIRAATRCHGEMASFASAGVDGRVEE